MSNNNSKNRFSRQMGLVHQEKVENLRVGMSGSYPLVEEQLKVFASHLGVKDFPIDKESDCTFVLSDVEESEGIQIHISMMKSGFRICTSPFEEDVEKNPETIPLLAPGLATLAAAMAWQEVLKRTGCIRNIPILKKYLTAQFRIGEIDSVGKTDDLTRITATYGNKKLAVFNEPIDDGTGHHRITARIDLDSEIVQTVLNAVDLNLSSDGIEDSPFSFKFTIPEIHTPPEGNLLVAGLGGLGSWSLYSLLRGILNQGGDGSGLTLSMFDPDGEVEEHNLNRQVLYDVTHLGRSKATCAEEVFRSKLPGCEIHSGEQSIGIADLQRLVQEGDSITDDGKIINDEEDVDLLQEYEIEELQTLSFEQVSDLIQKTDLILCGVDNLHSRGVLSGIAARMNIPMINAGSQNFSGQFDIFNGDSCMACRYGDASVRDRRIASCQQDGDIPVASIVTTTAILGTLQGLATLTALSDNETFKRWPEQATWGGRSNILRSFQPMAFSSNDDHVDHIITALSGISDTSQD